MALTAADKRTIASLIANALKGANMPAVSAPVVVAAEDQHIGPSGKPDGRRFLCTADEPCGRLLRSAARASVHAVGAALAIAGHQPAAE